VVQRVAVALVVGVIMEEESPRRLAVAVVAEAGVVKETLAGGQARREILQAKVGLMPLQRNDERIF
jgi:hypothetical protein